MSANRIAIITFSLLSALSPAHSGQPSAQSGTQPQYVLISFDGAGPLAQWERSRRLGREADARFTYFLSCVYLLTPETRGMYTAPGSRGPKSNVGYAAGREEVAARLQHIWSARAEGHEIASHGCGHLDGGKWSAADWQHEFAQFATVLENAWQLNRVDGEPVGWRRFARNEVIGFRAPYLSSSGSLFKALRASGFTYDASTVSRAPLPVPREDGVFRFALPLIPEGPAQRPIIAMDYNLYVRHSRGEEDLAAADIYEQRAYEAFMAAFRREYEGSRAPLQIGLHFTLMNGGAYWRALESFARDVCRRNDVRCVSHREYLEQTHGIHPDRRIDG